MYKMKDEENFFKKNKIILNIKIILIIKIIYLMKKK